MLAMMVAAVSFTACGGSDDAVNDGGGGNGSAYGQLLDGKISVLFESSSKTTTYYAANSEWVRLYQDVQGGSKYDSDNGYTFSAGLSSNVDVEALQRRAKELGEYWELAYMEYTWLSWQFQTKGDIQEGMEVSISGIFWNDTAVNTNQEDGKVYVKSIKDGKIILAFQNLKFKRCKVWKVGNSEFEMLTVNGDITFKKGE